MIDKEIMYIIYEFKDKNLLNLLKTYQDESLILVKAEDNSLRRTMNCDGQSFFEIHVFIAQFLLKCLEYNIEK